MKVYSATRLENGNTLVGTGDGHSVLEIAPTHETVWSIGEQDLKDTRIAWVTMTERLPNGSTWIVNCHAGTTNPQILEVTPTKEIIGAFQDYEKFGNALPVAVSMLQMIPWS